MYRIILRDRDGSERDFRVNSEDDETNGWRLSIFAGEYTRWLMKEQWADGTKVYIRTT